MRKLFFLLICLLFISSVSAIGVSPGRVSFSDYSSVNMQKTATVTVVNTGSFESTIVVSAQGELAEYISFPQRSFTLAPGQTEKSFEYTVNLPEGLSPGPHTAEIIILELPQEGSFGETYIGAAVAVLSELYVFVPYPGRFAEGRLVVDRLEDGSLNFVIPTLSQGSFDLVDVFGRIEIYNSANQVVETLQTEAVTIPTRERKDLSVNWVPTLPNGNYRAVATVTYGGDQPLVVEAPFVVGESRLRLADVAVRDFTLGDVAKIEMVVESQWSEPIQGVNIEMLVYDQRGNLVDTVRTSSETIGSGERVTMLGYWETLGVPQGEYTAELYIRSAASTTETNRNLLFELSEDAFVVVGFGYVISAGGDSAGSAIYYLTGAIVVLILINLSWFIFLRKRFTGGEAVQTQQVVPSIDSVDASQPVYSN